MYMSLLQYGDTVLHEAARWGHYDLLKVVINTGIALDIKGHVSQYNYMYVHDMCICSSYTE